MGFDYSRANHRWRRLRDRVLREQRWCQEAKRYGELKPAEIVHHVWPVEDYNCGCFYNIFLFIQLPSVPHEYFRFVPS